ncbi:putative 50S ribosome-binding GTPase/Dynamin family [Aphelenchoides fujianensis]|nr:putative 50S ribosome-binding GTPase/Dynamin family [Aphelenchoides fujianensis]
MESLISVVNDLHQALSNVDSSGKEIQLPLIVVVGAQSEGKSSIIERIVGWDFLPRSEDIVTRMPLVLNIVKCPKGDVMRKELGADPDGEFGIFRNNPRVFEIDELADQIEQITLEKAGGNKASSPSLFLR